MLYYSAQKKGEPVVLKEEDPDQGNVIINGKILNNVDTFRYFGIIIS